MLVLLSIPCHLEGEVGAREPRELAWDVDVDGPVTLVGATTWFGTEALKGTLAPSACRWCDTNDFDRSVRDGLRWNDTKAADALSNILGYGAAPVMIGLSTLVAAHDRALRMALVDALLIAESAVLAGNLSQLVKFSGGRERPWATGVSFPDTRDAHLSFYSAHASLAFSVVMTAGTVATMREYRWAPLVWIVGMPYALATGYLRIAADQHWFTDALVGAVLGSAIGFAVPFFFHRPKTVVRVVPMGAGAAIVAGY